MSTSKYRFAQEFGFLAGKMMQEDALDILQINVALHPEMGVCVNVGANGGTLFAIDHLMGKGWLSDFGNEVGDALNACKEFNEIIQRRAVEIIVAGDKKLTGGASHVD